MDTLRDMDKKLRVPGRSPVALACASHALPGDMPLVVTFRQPGREPWRVCR